MILFVSLVTYVAASAIVGLLLKYRANIASYLTNADMYIQRINFLFFFLRHI